MTSYPRMSVIYCDIDVPFEKFLLSPEAKVIREELKTIPHTAVFIRMSSGGNTHLKVSLKAPVTVLRYIQLRAVLGDDPQHLACDLGRMYRFGDDTARQNLTADKKIKQGRLLLAGEWQPYLF
jgi:hypothetical protein